MAFYSAGSVAVTNGSKIVTGNLTAFVANAKAGEALQLSDGQLREIEAVNSDTQLTLVKPYGGPAASGMAYQVVPTRGGYIRDLAVSAGQLVQAFSDTKALIDNEVFLRKDGGQITGPLALKDAAGSAAAMSRWLAFRDAAGHERGWIGYGHGNSWLSCSNTIGPLLYMTSGIERMRIDAQGHTTFRSSVSLDNAAGSSFKLPAFAGVGNRPSAVAAGAGALYFDTALNRMVYSDGSGWFRIDNNAAA